MTERTSPISVSSIANKIKCGKLPIDNHDIKYLEDVMNFGSKNGDQKVNYFLLITKVSCKKYIHVIFLIDIFHVNQR